MDIDNPSFSITDIQTMTEQLHANLLTAKSSSDSAIVHASLIEAVEGLLLCVKSIASELIKVEVRGIETATF